MWILPSVSGSRIRLFAWVSPVMAVSIPGTNSLLPDSVFPIESKRR